jgi:hypothetical protein
MTNTILVFAGTAVVLFVLSFWSKRRFGVLGLALAAGSVLAGLWLNDASMLIGALGIIPRGNITNAVTIAIVTVLPAVVLMFHGHAYKDFIPRAVGAILFTVLGLAFLASPIEIATAGGASALEIYRRLENYQGLIISLGLIVAVLDLVFTRNGKSLEKRGKR